jgi:hypothetical protein
MPYKLGANHRTAQVSGRSQSACQQGAVGCRQARTLVFRFRQGAHAQLDPRRGVCKHILGRLRGFTASRLPGNRPTLRHYFGHIVCAAGSRSVGPGTMSAHSADKYRSVSWEANRGGVGMDRYCRWLSRLPERVLGSIEAVRVRRLEIGLHQSWSLEIRKPAHLP